MDKFKILALNNISARGLERLPLDHFEVASEMSKPDAILLRSFNMHEMPIPETLLAVGRAGAGVNNIPVARMSDLGIPVFNAPGANSNAVKELVIAAMLMGCRNIGQAWQFTRQLEGSKEELNQLVEKGKKQFSGFELPGKTLGVIGLGAIGVLVANAAVALGMRVIGYDPTITVERAWALSATVIQGRTTDDVLEQSDFVTFHVPLLDSTRGLIDRERLALMKKDVVVINFARQGIVDDEAMLEGLNASKVYAYMTDFPNPALLRHPRVITLPHLGASTREAEENCAIMVADEVRNYLEHGTIRNSVNYPEVDLARRGAARIVIANANRPDMLGQISHHIGRSGLNIAHMVNESKGDFAFTVVDVDAPVNGEVQARLAGIEGVLKVRVV
ncbi:MAG: 3-phosphoglycerate dehydrogenase family protein [Thiotrichales bacterium]